MFDGIFKHIVAAICLLYKLQQITTYTLTTAMVTNYCSRDCLINGSVYDGYLAGADYCYS